MNVRLLGPIEVRLEDRPIKLGPRKQRALLAMLALQSGRAVSTDRLVEGLWGEEPPASAAKMVQLYVSHVRRVLGSNGARIVTQGRSYELRLSDGDVDVVRAERLLDEGRAREALGLWRGEPLADLADEPFAALEIRRLGELRLRAAEMAIDVDLESGRHAEVIGELDALVAEAPLRERLHAQRMLALYRAGRQAEALEAYHHARAALVEQIGVEPGAELRGLHEAILAHDPALGHAARPAPTAVPRPLPRPPPRRAARGLLVGAALVFLGAVIAFGVIRTLEPDGLPGIRENFVGVIDPVDGRISEQYSVGESPSAVTGGGGSVWIANQADGTVTRIDRDRDRDPVVTIPVDGAPAAVAFGGDSLWVADSDARTVAQIDPGQNKVVLQVEVGNAPRALAVAAGALWVASGVDGRITGFDLGRGRITRSVAIGANPSALVAGAGALWVASEEAGTVTRVEPRTGSVVGTITVGNGPSALAAGDGAIWVINRQDGTLSRIDPATNSVSGLVRVGNDPTAVAAGRGTVWVAGGEDGIVTRIDPVRLQVVKKTRTGNNPAAIAMAGGSVWAAASVTQAAHRGGTLRVLLSDPPIPIDSLHRLAYGGVRTFQLSSLAYDGLVAYRRVEGAAGAALVGALATTAPSPSRDGRSYVFTLRPSLRFSDGTPVRPEDFRASIERFLEATRGYPAADRFPPLYAGILGARRCMRGGRCDLSRGIVTDSRTRTIAVYLERPDAEFLHKLTMTWASVVPGGSAARATEGRPPPGTGPYRVAAWDAGRGGVLVRNPHFRAGPAPSRPSGFADRIEVSVRRDDTIEEQIGEVQRGTADLAVIANPFISTVAPDRLRALAAHNPGRVHSAPAAATDWMYLNAERRPFDDIRVRRAVNLAVDRAHLVELTGGPEVAQPACQAVPIAFPGYAPHCPYTANPSAGGAWTAPDLDRARRLVEASGRAGERVGVWMPPFRRPVGRYFTALLNRLGFHATLHSASAGAGGPDDPSTRAQVGAIGWSPDYLAPSTFVQESFACVPADQVAAHRSRLCDSILERRIHRALAAPPPDAAEAWAAADRRLTDLAAIVPMTNRRTVVLVSKRVGNVKHHAQWSTLLDQLWVA